MIPVVSFFCGAGGLDYGFKQEGFKTILAYDADAAAVKTYNFNARKKIAHAVDLQTLTATRLFEMLESNSPNLEPMGLIGGPPCQGFSIGNVHSDPADPRNQLPFRYADLLRALNERFALHFFLFENVPGLKSAKHIKRFEMIKDAFEAAGFRIFEQALNAKYFGVAQSRRRLFVIGLNRVLYPKIELEFPTGSDVGIRTVRDAISGLPSPMLFERGINQNRIPHHRNHWTMKPRSEKFRTEVPSNGRSFRRLDWLEPSPTVAYGNREIHVHPNGSRRLSVYEAMLLQGFPDSYQLKGTLSNQITQVSNAVPPPMARALAATIRQLLIRH